jgi:hypothetical protein
VVHHPQNMAATAETLPAYPGARFNSSGFCTNHSNVRLCIVTNEGKYKILRKTCFKCGSSSLMNNFTPNTTNKMHGFVKKDLPSRDLPKGIFSATASSNGGSGSDSKKNQQPSTSRLRGDHNSTDKKETKPLPSPQVPGREKTRESTSTKKGVISTKTKKDRNSRSKETTTFSTKLGPKLEGGTRCSRSRSRSLSTSRTKASLSLSELTELCPPPPGIPTRRSRSKSSTRTKKPFGKDNISLSSSRTKTSMSLSELTELCAPPPGIPTRRSRSKSSTRTKKPFGKDNISLSTPRTKTSLSLSELTELCPPPPGIPTRRSRSKSCSKTKKSFGKDNIKDSNKKAAVRSTPIITSSSKLVEEKIREITKSKKSFGKADYTELGKLIKMRDDENTLPTTLSCPSTPESFESKQAVFTFDKKSGLIVELCNDKESGETVPSSIRRRDTFTRGCK